MKNFRKVLALILVVATLFSFVAMASAKTADEYSDYADVKYVEAVDVLTAIGINEGYDGAFHPADPIDRDEVAAMVARLRNGGTIDADLYVGADKVFADVKGQWSEGYVTYCSQLGIIAGRNASTFDPDGKVTGTEVLKMLLCVLGYDAAEQGYTGANWQVNVVRDAAKSELLIEGVDVYAAATRDEVAQYFLNALKAKMVIGYIGEGLINITNSIWVEKIGEGRRSFKIYDTVTPDSIGDGVEVAYCNAVISNDFLWESIPGLKIDVENERDCYGRPGYVWTLTKGLEVVFEKFYAYAPEATYTTAALAAAELGEEMEAGYTVKTFVNGELETSYWGTTEDTLGLLDKTGNGIKTEIYVIGTEVTVVIIHAYIDEVVAINTYKGTFTLKSGYKFDLDGAELAVGDMVIYHLCNGGLNHAEANDCTGGNCEAALHDIAVVEPITATVEYGRCYKDRDINKSYFIADGKTYNYNFNLGRMYDLSCAPMIYDDVAANPKVDIYVDEYGYVMYWEVNDTTDKFITFVEEGTLKRFDRVDTMGADGDTDRSYTYNATTVDYAEADGALTANKETKVSKNLWNAMKAFGFTYDTGDLYDVYDADAPGALIKYEKDAKGNMINIVEADFVPAGGRLTKESYVIYEGPEGNVYADNDTIFMIRTKNLDGTYSYEQVTGYKNLPATYVADLVKNIELTDKCALEEHVHTKVANSTTDCYDWVLVCDDAEAHGDADKHVNNYDVNDETDCYDYALTCGYAEDYEHTHGEGDCEWIPADPTEYTNIQYFVDPLDDSDFAAYVFIDAKYTASAADHFVVLGKADYFAFNLTNDELYKDDYVAYKALVDEKPGVVLVDKNADWDIGVGLMYEDILQYVGWVSTYDGDLPLYAYVDTVAPTPAKFVDTLDLHKDGKEIWVKADGVRTLVAEGGLKVFTLLVDSMDEWYKEDITYTTYFEETDKITSMKDLELSLKNCYVLYNEDGEIYAIYRIAREFLNEF